MSAPKKLDAQTETQVVALLARGDTQQEIVDWLKEEHDIKMSIAAIGVIKKRNAQALQYMQTQLIKHETTMATGILEKSRKLIDRKLSRALTLEEELKELRQKFDNQEIDSDEYYREFDILMRSQLTVQELNSLSKESFNQSQLEAGKPTAIADNPAQAKANLAVLLDAIKDRDDAKALEAIFPDD